ncbi:MAG: polysaccharide biosynthesis/export family protein [Pseudomonadota bacterium]
MLSVFVSSEAYGQLAEYALEPGDRLTVTVWKDPDLSREVLVAPDGEIAFPLAGRLQAAGRTIKTVTEELTGRLEAFIEDPVVTVSLLEVRGSRVYIIGKVNRPGMYLLDGPMDVMQALSLAGGTTTYADVNDIRILRREGKAQKAYLFQYNQVSRGRKLEQNQLLLSGDTVVVN